MPSEDDEEIVASTMDPGRCPCEDSFDVMNDQTLECCKEVAARMHLILDLPMVLELTTKGEGSKECCLYCMLAGRSSGDGGDKVIVPHDTPRQRHLASATFVVTRSCSLQGQLLEIGLDVSGGRGNVFILSEGQFKLFALAR
jgi:hypothetical protein